MVVCYSAIKYTHGLKNNRCGKGNTIKMKMEGASICERAVASAHTSKYGSSKVRKEREKISV